MSTPNINCILQAVLAAQNNLISPPPMIANYDFGNPTFGATAMFFDPFFQATGVFQSLSLPTATIFGLLVQNLGTSTPLTISYTPTGFATQSLNLGPGTAANPGDAFLYWCPSKNSNVGITFVSLAGLGGPTPAMVLMVG